MAKYKNISLDPADHADWQKIAEQLSREKEIEVKVPEAMRIIKNRTMKAMGIK